MRVGLFFTIILLNLVGQPASAGAWLREKGSSFTATSFSATYFRDTSQSAYLEFGARDDLTLGVDINLSTTRFGFQSGHATLFMRRPLGQTNGTSRWAYELGAGASWVGDIVFPHGKLGLSWGRGFQLNERNGWMAVDASLRWDIGRDLRVAKIDSTVGYDFSNVTTGMMQVFVTNQSGQTTAKIAPSLIISPGFSKFRFQIGTETPVNSPRDTALKIGLWRSF